MHTKTWFGLLALLGLIVLGTSPVGAGGEAGGEEKEAPPAASAAQVPTAVAPGAETQGNGNNYVLLDSVDSDGPVFYSPVFVPTTVAAVVSAADDASEMVPLGFTFVFYGVSYTSAFVGSNGYLTFGAGDSSFANSDLSTNTNVPVPGVFAFFDDLDPSSGGTIRYDTFGPPGSRVFVVEFDDVEHFPGSPNGITFQIRLFEGSNDVEVHYLDPAFASAVFDFGASATTGVRAGTAGSPFLQYSNNSAVLDPGLAIRYFVPRCGGSPATLVGTRGDDTVLGTGGPDVIFGHDGDDLLRGFGDDDTLCGANGDDELRGGPGDDDLRGGPGLDELKGQVGDDDLRGQGDGDRLNGGTGLDLLIGGDDTDVLFGGPDEDLLQGNDGDDFLFGQDDDDVVQGGNGEDRANGGTGDDVVNGLADDDVVKGGIGEDTVNGGSGDDLVRGGADDDTVRGGGDDDRLQGEAGDDTLQGGGGDDTLNGGADTDSCAGGPGTDSQAFCEVVSGIP